MDVQILPRRDRNHITLPSNLCSTHQLLSCSASPHLRPKEDYLYCVWTLWFLIKKHKREACMLITQLWKYSQCIGPYDNIYTLCNCFSVQETKYWCQKMWPSANMIFADNAKLSTVWCISISSFCHLCSVLLGQEWNMKYDSKLVDVYSMFICIKFIFINIQVMSAKGFLLKPFQKCPYIFLVTPYTILQFNMVI